MTILCANGCHVYRAGNLHCTCGAAANGYPPTAGMIFQGYNPYSHHAPAKPAADVPLAQFRAAKALEDATHLSADGQRVYLQRMGKVRVCFWDEESKKFGSSFPCLEGLPGDAVTL